MPQLALQQVHLLLVIVVLTDQSIVGLLPFGILSHLLT